MVKVFSRTGEKDTWRHDPTRDIGQAMADRAERLSVGWTKDDIAEFEGMDDVVWKAWHATLYDFDRLYDRETGLDLLVIKPSRADRIKVWVSDFPFSFISSMQDAVRDLLSEQETKSGTRYIVRPGKAKLARIYRVSLYASRVIAPMPGQ